MGPVLIATLVAILNLFIPALVGAADLDITNRDPSQWAKRPILTITKLTTFCSLCVTTNTTIPPETTTSTVLSTTEITAFTTLETTSSIPGSFISTGTVRLTITSSVTVNTNQLTATPTTYSSSFRTNDASPGSESNSDSGSSTQTSSFVGIPGGGYGDQNSSLAVTTTSTTPLGHGYQTKFLTSSVSLCCTSEVTAEGGTGKAPLPSACPTAGPEDVRNFTLAFDDIAFKSSPVAEDDIDPPIKSPYHRFWFSSGFFLQSPPPAPFSPSSGTSLVSFAASELLGQDTSPNVPIDSGYIGAGLETSLLCMRFNFRGISLGCQSLGDRCEFKLTGRRARPERWGEDSVIEHSVAMAPCTKSSGCTLSHVQVSGFNNLTSVWVSAKVANQTVVWWADDLEVGWTDNGCDASDCRAAVPDTEARRMGKSRSGTSW